MEQKVEQLKYSVTHLFKRRVAHFIFAGVIVLILVFFFTSRLWLSASGTVSETKVGAAFSIGDSNATVQLKGWQIHPEGEFMIADIGISDMNLTKEVGYAIGVYDATGKNIESQILYNGNNYIILNIPKAAKQKALSISVQSQTLTEDGELAEKTQTVTFSCITENVEQDRNISTALSDEGYVLYDMENELNILELKKDEINSGIIAENNIIETAKAKITALEEKQQYQTTDELAESDAQIGQLKISITNAQENIGKLETEMYDINDQIQNKENIIQEYRENNGLS